MRNTRNLIPALCLMGMVALGFAALAPSRASAAPAERFLHVRVNNQGSSGQSVNLNVPLSMAEKILPAVNHAPLHNGRVAIPTEQMNGVDVRAILDAIRDAPDNNFVTVKSKGQNVRVSKSRGNIVVHVSNADGGDQNVDVSVPLKVVDALFSTTSNNEIDISAALRALAADDTGSLLVTVQSASQQVRIWVDSNSSSD